MAKKQPDASPSVTVALTPNPDQAGDAALTQALGLVVTDKASHESVLVAVKTWKEDNRTIEADYRDRLVQPLYKAYKAALGMMERHLAPRAKAIEIGSRVALDWTAAEQRRVELEQQRQREENERIAREQREKELADAEAQAAALEAASENLSEREQIFVEQFVATNNSIKAAQRAGYKDAQSSASRLLNQKKILAAVEAQRTANTIRQQAEAKAAQPLQVADVVVESQTAKVVGVASKTYYACGDVDLRVLAQAWLDGKVEGGPIQADTVFLNGQARQLRDLFERAYPGCKVKKTSGLAG